MTISDKGLLRLALDVRADYLDELGRPTEAESLREEDLGDLPDNGAGPAIEKT